MFVLAIDTSSPAVTAGVVSIAEQAVLTAERSPLAARGHGELLAPAIADCLRDAGLEPAGIDAVVAGVGPGPFTGLRVGLVTAAAFADAIAAPTYGVCSLDAIAAACADEPALLVVTDARRREVYWAHYEYGRRKGSPAVCAPAEIPIEGISAVAGAGGELYSHVWPDLPRRLERYPGARALVSCAGEQVTTRAPSQPLTPLYLRRPDAVVPGAPKQVTR